MNKLFFVMIFEQIYLIDDKVLTQNCYDDIWNLICAEMHWVQSWLFALMRFSDKCQMVNFWFKFIVLIAYETAVLQIVDDLIITLLIPVSPQFILN